LNIISDPSPLEMACYKAPAAIIAFDEITGGGLPSGLFVQQSGAYRRL